MIIEARCPVRIDLAGPWTDCPEFYESNKAYMDGATFNMAIVPIVTECGYSRPAYVSGRLDTGGVDDITATGPSGGIKVRVEKGTSVTYTAGTVGSGLGTSAAMTALWLALIRGINDEDLSEQVRKQIAESSHQVERALGILGGKQDQYAAVFGGANLFTFFAEGGTGVIPVQVSPAFLQKLKDSMILFNTQETRLSSNIHAKVWSSFDKGSNADTLNSMANMALEMLQAFKAEDIGSVGILVSETWERQKELHESVTNQSIDDTFLTLEKAGILWGGKALGAGGGGHLLFLVDPDRRELAESILSYRPGRIVDFNFDFEGLVVTRKEK